MEPEVLEVFCSQLRELQAHVTEAMNRVEERTVYDFNAEDSSDLRCLQGIRLELDSMAQQTTQLRKWKIEENCSMGVLINQLMESRSSLMRRIEASMKDVVTERAVVEEALAFVTAPQGGGSSFPPSPAGARSPGGASERSYVGVGGATGDLPLAPRELAAAMNELLHANHSHHSHVGGSKHVRGNGGKAAGGKENDRDAHSHHRPTQSSRAAPSAPKAGGRWRRDPSVERDEDWEVERSVKPSAHGRKSSHSSPASVLDMEAEYEIQFLSNPLAARQNLGSSCPYLAPEPAEISRGSRRPCYYAAGNTHEAHPAVPSWPTSSHTTTAVALRASEPVQTLAELKPAPMQAATAIPITPPLKTSKQAAAAAAVAPVSAAAANAQFAAKQAEQGKAAIAAAKAAGKKMGRMKGRASDGDGADHRGGGGGLGVGALLRTILRGAAVAVLAGGVITGVEAHQNGQLQPMLKRSAAACRRWAAHTSTTVQARSGAAWSHQAPRVRTALRGWQQSLFSNRGKSPSAPTPPSRAAAKPTASSPSSTPSPSPAASTPASQAASTKPLIVAAGVQPHHGVVRVRETSFYSELGERSPLTANVLVGRG